MFLDLPGQSEAYERKLPETKLIPTAAELERQDSNLVRYVQIRRWAHLAPVYPEKAESFEKLQQARKEYWDWFNDNFNATKAITVVEAAASENGRIRWIDYRLPLTSEGDTLHLHMSPSGTYDTGVLAYNFVKRGYTHGLRIVGTLKVRNPT